jgi:hypothetical protein
MCIISNTLHNLTKVLLVFRYSLCSRFANASLCCPLHSMVYSRLMLYAMLVVTAYCTLQQVLYCKKIMA